jgi:hypothetical protein
MAFPAFPAFLASPHLHDFFRFRPDALASIRQAITSRFRLRAALRAARLDNDAI